MLFSILICTIADRKAQFEELYNFLLKQREPFENDVEILTAPDNENENKMTVGAKRQKLLEKAKGLFCAAVDDDDTVDNLYIPLIRNAIIENPEIDHITFRMDISALNAYLKYHQITNNKLGIANSSLLAYHFLPVKREIALKIGFRNTSHAEDADYSFRIKPYLKKEYFIDKVLYYYRFKPKNFFYS